MQKTLHISLIFIMFAFIGVQAQNANFYIIPASVQLQVQGKGGELIPFYYRVIYHADTSNKQPFTGWVRTLYSSNNNSLPGKSEDSASTADNVFGGGPLYDGDTMGVYGHIRIDADYFRNGKNNFIVIWPTGGRASGKQEVVLCIDSVKFPKNILVSGLTGIEKNNPGSQIVKIYPNPANTFFRIEFFNPDLKITKLRLFSMIGKELMTIKDVNDLVDISRITCGTYYVEITCSDTRVVRYPLIISH